MKLFIIILASWLALSFLFSFVFWPTLMMAVNPKDNFLKSKCRKCGHIQRCCAPPCAKCNGIDMEMLK